MSKEYEGTLIREMHRYEVRLSNGDSVIINTPELIESIYDRVFKYGNDLYDDENGFIIRGKDITAILEVGIYFEPAEDTE